LNVRSISVLLVGFLLLAGGVFSLRLLYVFRGFGLLLLTFLSASSFLGLGFGLHVVAAWVLSRIRGVRWACGCPFCRFTVLRILGSEEAGRGAESAEELAEEAPQIPESEVPQFSAGVEAQSSQPRSVDASEVAARVVEVLREELKSLVEGRIQPVERSVEEVKEGLKSFAEEVRTALVELRSSITESSNPFNVLKKYAEVFDEDARKLLQLLASGRAGAIQQLPPEYAAKAGEILDFLRGLGLQLPIGLQASPLGRFVKVVKWVAKNFSEAPREAVESALRVLVDVGVLSEADAKLFMKAYELVEEAEKRGEQIEDVLLRIYSVAKLFGVSDAETDAELLELLIRRNRGGKGDEGQPKR